MTLHLILPWFPIVLSAAIGGRLVGRSRSNWLGISCALFWIVVVQTTTGPAIWSNLSAVASLLAGSVAIVGMTIWSADLGRHDSDRSDYSPHANRGTRAFRRRANERASERADSLELVTGTIAQFDDWLESHRFSADPWPAFGEFIRNVLHLRCGAAHVRPYRILSEEDVIVPLRVIDPTDTDAFRSARAGILGHVATTGRTYVSGDTAQGKLVQQLAASSDSDPVWCFAIQQSSRKIGLVAVRQWQGGSPSRPLLDTLEALINQFWSTLTEVCRSRSAVRVDVPTMMLTREAFLEEAQDAVEQSFEAGEPVALAVFALEGLRALADGGQWDQASHAVRETSKILRERVRPDDLLGRFDDSRFCLLLRRVDSALASLIAEQLVARLSASPLTAPLTNGTAGIRCGIVGSGAGSPTAGELVARAIRLCHEARLNQICVASDVAGETNRRELQGVVSESTAS